MTLCNRLYRIKFPQYRGLQTENEMHDEFPAVDSRHQEIIDTAATLDRISFELAELLRIKEELDKRLAALLEQKEEGQCTYTEGRFKITVRSGYNYTLDKEKYEMLSRHLNSSIDPIEKRVKYEINKKTLRESYAMASEKELEILNEIISKKPAKLSVVISAGITS